jgi:NAD(P)-dependent dehydrogenase (short-subunit alcohol dehydrogenase family)
MRLKGKSALITGGTSGIGRATARLFCKEGAKVVVVGRTEKKGIETVKIINNEGGEAFFIRADVSKAIDAERIVNKTVTKHGRIDILFNNAGIGSGYVNIEDMSEAYWDEIIDVNLKSMFLLSKYTIPVMRKQGGGVIINTASTFGFVAQAKEAAYCASKGGVVQFTKAAALELAQYNIRVNCVCPGTITTVNPNGVYLYGKEKSQEWVESRTKKFPIGRLGRPIDVAYAVLYLASDESSFTTGSALFTDGGFTTQ